MSDAYPSFLDLAAYPQLVLDHVNGCRGGDDILEGPAGLDWIHRRPPCPVEGAPVSREHVRRRALP